MSKGTDSRTSDARKGEARTSRDTKGPEARTSRSSVKMTAERARAIQATVDRSGHDDGFKSRAMAAAARNEAELADGEDE